MNEENANNIEPNNTEQKQQLTPRMMNDILRNMGIINGRHSKQRQSNGAFGSKRKKPKGVWRPL